MTGGDICSSESFNEDISCFAKQVFVVLLSFWFEKFKRKHSLTFNRYVNLLIYCYVFADEFYTAFVIRFKINQVSS